MKQKILSHCSYYQKVPDALPEIPKQQVFGLATPEDFTLPPLHPLWTEEVYASFNVPEGQQEGTKYDSTVREKERENILSHIILGFSKS